MQHETDAKQMTADTVTLVAAYLSNSHTNIADIPGIFAAFGTEVSKLHSPAPAAPEAEARKEPAVSIKKSVTADFLICLEDGRKFKSLKRHLRTKYGMTPEDYRAKWGLPSDYPMTAPSYAEKRSELAKAAGLGRGLGGRRAAAPKADATTTAKAPKVAKAKAAPKAKAPKVSPTVAAESKQAAEQLATA